MNSKKNEEDQVLIDHIASYEYIDKEGLLDLENFSCTLSGCFARDGNLQLSPKPRDVYLLLIEKLENVDELYKNKRFVFYQPISPWRDEYLQVYPERHITKIHVSGLCLTWYEWIYDIGRTLMEIEPVSESPKYFYWAKTEWTFVHTFINGFHKAFTELMKKTDKNGIDRSGFSGWEALHRSISENEDFDVVAGNLKARRAAQKEAMDEVFRATAAGYYLEAITLQECLISNVLFSYTSGKGVNLKGPTLNRLIIEVKKLTKKSDEGTLGLLAEIDDWRKLRNRAIHGAVTQKIEIYTSSKYGGKREYGDTVNSGEKICHKLFQWYDEMAINFIATDFEDTQKH